jgi:hypothetical protein
MIKCGFIAASVLGYIYYTQHKNHSRNLQIINRLSELNKNNTKLSGVYVNERPPFPNALGPISRLLPYHVSLTINNDSNTNCENVSSTINNNGNANNDNTNRNVGIENVSSIIDNANNNANRNVGIGIKKSDNFTLTSEFILHEGVSYDKLKDVTITYPIECWPEYYNKFGNYPKNINVAKLNELTLTRQELADDQDDTNLYKITFGKPGFDKKGNFIFNSCRSSLLDVVYQEQESRI